MLVEHVAAQRSRSGCFYAPRQVTISPTQQEHRAQHAAIDAVHYARDKPPCRSLAAGSNAEPWSGDLRLLFDAWRPPHDRTGAGKRVQKGCRAWESHATVHRRTRAGTLKADATARPHRASTRTWTKRIRDTISVRFLRPLRMV